MKMFITKTNPPKDICSPEVTVENVNGNHKLRGDTHHRYASGDRVQRHTHASAYW